ncbi:MAG: 5-formyltetrahydrofolate cyclo-ligase [Gracilimonas sp.]|uniref:5-formyltetrahydrofolate cyclo-ligase n=1 Tax=Gracilimonas TaxID=649462 RepID=UPI001B19A30E|nr:5-formyltetrahydrofolate cyclo-ligase [Gracilimonas sp.]MBO6586496.1 5-formyltetrahydrofolate cyclo-ligase [Gracilimonas sp.]MBO6615153.1 5-formyltetrahydrofolate cyclo-ligase [Gracilimonas sp.]
MSSISQQKQDLREKVLAERLQIPDREWKNKSDQIISSLTNADYFKEAKTVHTYISMNQRREVYTDGLLEDILNGDKRAVVPVTNFEDRSLTHSEIRSLSDLKKNKWGVEEPKHITPVNVKELELIIVPMAAADRAGNRLGYGKGFYDRFLKEAKAIKVGLVFDAFLFDEIPIEEFDEKLDVIISEEEVIFA